MDYVFLEGRDTENRRKVEELILLVRALEWGFIKETKSDGAVMGLS